MTDCTVYFKENMTAMGLPVPAELFTTFMSTIGMLSAMEKVVTQYGTSITFSEAVGAGFLADGLLILGGVGVAYYAGGVAGSVGVAITKCISNGNSISEIFSDNDLLMTDAEPEWWPQEIAYNDPGGDPGNGGGYGGGGGGGGCVAINSFLPDGSLAGDVIVGTKMQLADQQSLEAGTGIVTFSQRKEAAGFRITTSSGVSLICSDTAPIPTPDGVVLAPLLLGKSVAIRRDDGSSSHIGWEVVTEVDAIGKIEVQHITVGDKCFWAGETKSAYILHHNIKDNGGGGGGEGDDPWDDGWDGLRAPVAAPAMIVASKSATLENAQQLLIQSMAAFSATGGTDAIGSAHSEPVSTTLSVNNLPA